MSLNPMAMWAISCDHEGCEVSTNDLTGGEISAWSSVEETVDHWLDCEGTTDGFGHHYCYNHAADYCKDGDD